MADLFRLAWMVLDELAASKPSTPEGMTTVVERLASQRGGKVWSKCDRIDWAAGQQLWDRWFADLLSAHALPPETELLYFEVPSEINPAMTSVSAYAEFDGAALDDELDKEDRESLAQMRAEAAAELRENAASLPACLADLPKTEAIASRVGLHDDARIWPIDEEGYTIEAGLHELPQLQEALQLAGWDLEEGDERLEPGVYAISLAYAWLLVRNGLGAGMQSERGLTVLVGWLGGDYAPVGQLTKQGWGEIPELG
ncbi:MAG: hypothetical protein JJU33_10755 [Phycisphaerales bacterium]|nr:hypothetical protein [Phycisphaerales bacterium]